MLKATESKATYEAFQAVWMLCNKGNSADAAAALGCDPKALRRRIKAAEKAYGFDLFHYEPGPNDPTPLPITHQLLPSINNFLNATEIMFATPKMLQDKDFVNIGVTHMLELMVKLALDPHIFEKLPNVHFQTSSLSKNQLSSRGQDLDTAISFIDSGELDLMLYYDIDTTPPIPSLSTPNLDMREYKVTTIYKEHNLCVVNKDADASDPITIEQYRKLSPLALDRQLLAIFSNGMAPPPKWETFSLDSTLSFIARNPGYVCCPPELPVKLLGEGKNLKLVQPAKEMLFSEWHLKILTKPDDKLSPVVRIVREELVTGIQKLRQEVVV